MDSLPQSPRTILLILSEKELSALFSVVILRGIYRVLEAHNLADAQSLLSHTKPDLIIIEYQIGQESGIEFVKSLRSNTKFEKMPIIMYIVSDHGQSDEAKIAGVNGILSYPISPQTVLDTIKSHLI
jgi:response regulator RpfG family c-di-GMP phosphodiesterase